MTYLFFTINISTWYTKRLTRNMHGLIFSPHLRHLALQMMLFCFQDHSTRRRVSPVELCRVSSACIGDAPSTPPVHQHCVHRCSHFLLASSQKTHTGWRCCCKKLKIVLVPKSISSGGARGGGGSCPPPPQWFSIFFFFFFLLVISVGHGNDSTRTPLRNVCGKLFEVGKKLCQSPPPPPPPERLFQGWRKILWLTQQ